MKTIFSIFLTVALGLSALAQKQNLSFRLQSGSVYYQTMTANSQIKQNVSGQQIDINLTIVGKMSYKVNDLQNNIYKMDVTYESMSMKMNLPNNMSMEFSSEKKDDGDQITSMMSKILGALTKTPFQMEMTNKGKILSIKNMDVIFENMFKDFPNITPQQQAQIKAQIAQSFGDDSFKTNFEMMMAIYPDQPVAVGEKWKVESTTKKGMSLKTSSEFQLVSQASEINTIKGISKLEVIDKEAYTATNGIDMRFDIRGDMTTELNLNNKTGWIEDGKLTQTLKGNAITKDSPQIPGGMTIPMDMVTNMSIVGR